MEHINVSQLLRGLSGNIAILVDDDLTILDVSDSLLAIDAQKKICVGHNIFSLLKPATLFFPNIRDSELKDLFVQFMSTVPTKIGQCLFLWVVHSYKVKANVMHHLLLGVNITGIASTLKEMLFISNNVLNNIPYFLCWKDDSSNFLGCNKNFANLIGLSNYQEIIGKTDFDLPWTIEQSIKYRQDDQDVIVSGNKKIYYQEPQNQPDGMEHTVFVSKIPFQMSANSRGVVCIYRNIKPQ